MIAPGSPYTVTVFCLDVWPEVTSERHPVMVLKSSDTSLFARPSNGGALTLTFILRLHSSNPSGPERLDLGDTDTSTSTHPSRTLQTSETFMSPGYPSVHFTVLPIHIRHGPTRPRDMSGGQVVALIYGTVDGLPMSPALEPMSFDELSELYRVEMKSSAITQVRKDLFRAIANLLTSLRLEYDRQMALDPESVMCEGADQRRKKAERLAKDIVHIRTQKICQMAIRGAMGGRNALEVLTDEEKDYYERVLDLSKRHMSEVDVLRGKRKTVATHIDEVPEPVRAEPEPVKEAPAPPADEVPFDDSPDDFQDEPIPDEFDGFPEEPFDDVPPAPAEPAPAVAVKPETAPSEPEVSEEPPVEAPAEHPAQVDGDELEPILIRVMEDLPEFVGPDRDYKLLKEDLVMLPRVLAEVLINSEKAMAIRPTP